jgi:protein-S-isoprenylcysteine O-methyltransferase Ste14
MSLHADHSVKKHVTSEAEGAATRLDLGRLFGVPIMAGLLFLNVVSLVRSAGDGVAGSLTEVGSLLAGLLTAMLYCLLIAAFLRRSSARATHPSPVAAVAAGVATWLPFVIPLVPHGKPTAGVLVVANVLLVAGLSFSVWSIKHLDRSFSMIAQARRVVRTGPYAIVRHPLYTGELLALLGTVFSRPGWVTFAVWAAILGLQAYRVRHEEAILSSTLEDYREYQQVTPQLVPFTKRGVTAR